MRRKFDLHDFLAEDVGRGDITSELVVRREAKGRGRLVAKEACVVAGLLEAGELFVGLGCSFTALATDGERVKKATVVATAQGRAHALLVGERLALNIVQRMSGIATATRRAVEAARKVNPKVVIAATRKTTPGFRAYEKRAVTLGGGDPHRFGLDDMILVKDNHVAMAGGIRPALKGLKASAGGGPASPFAHTVEVEVSNAADAIAACEMGADIVMFDNMTVPQIRSAYRSVKARFPNVLVEVSGGFDASNVAKVAAFADIVSMGAITHSAPACDFSFKIEPIK
jgi:nicotinate-nucleotide pyrophosphorylase (carboxylating)